MKGGDKSVSDERVRSLAALSPTLRRAFSSEITKDILAYLK